VLTSPPLDADVLSTIRDKIVSIIMNKVISREGVFHCSNSGISKFLNIVIPPFNVTCDGIYYVTTLNIAL
jgi:hypothetical protein